MVKAESRIQYIVFKQCQFIWQNACGYLKTTDVSIPRFQSPFYAQFWQHYEKVIKRK